MTDTTIRDVALSCEAKLYAMRKSRDGMVVSFVIHPNDIPDGLVLAEIGTRFQSAFVEIGDDEKPKAAAQQPEPDPEAPARESKSWHEMRPAQQAGILCADKAFQNFLGVISEELAVLKVREMCGVKSRKDIAANRPSGLTWRNTVSDYRAWGKAAEVVPA